jgi:hypothetical protein
MTQPYPSTPNEQPLVNPHAPEPPEREPIHRPIPSEPIHPPMPGEPQGPEPEIQEPPGAHERGVTAPA